MKTADVTENGKDTKEVVAIFSSEEAKMMIAALEGYAAAHPRSPKAKKLLKQALEWGCF